MKRNTILILLTLSLLMMMVQPVLASTPVTGVNLSKTYATMTSGTSMTLTAAVYPTGATNKGVSWYSSNTSVATVSGGKVTAKKPGTATISVKTSDGGYKAYCYVTVKLTASAIVAKATSYLGVDYLYGGDSYSGIDCSHLVWESYYRAYTYKTATSWSTNLTSPPSGFKRVYSPQAGDVVVFYGHMGVMINSTQCIHAPQTGDVVKKSYISSMKPLGFYRFSF